jgi:hypothetical protein
MVLVLQVEPHKVLPLAQRSCRVGEQLLVL